MADRPGYVVDSSIVTRWYLNNPPYLDRTFQVRSDYRASQIALLAPDNLHYEVSGAIHRAVMAHQIRAEDGESQIARFLGLEITLIDADPLILPAYRLSIRFGCSFYDALYLAVAESTNRPFLHADASLHRALSDRFPLELWIEDYRRPV